MSLTDTVVIMVSLGNRTHLSSYTYPRLSEWAARHGYSCVLLKKYINNLNRSPHFAKLIAHKIIPGFKRYIIVDDDLMLKSNAPPIDFVPKGFVGLCRDVNKNLTEASHIKWTANSGFIVADDEATGLLEEAYNYGPYPYTWGDGSGKGIWGPYDQGILNDVLFRNDKIYELNWRWNYQPVLDYFVNRGKGWNTWNNSRSYRIGYYLSLISPVNNVSKKLIKEAYGLHMIYGLYPYFFSKIHK